MVERVLQPVGRATWLAAMTHPDGEISFFNDAAFDIAPTLADVVRYADVIFAARQAQPIPAVIPAPSPVITATTAVISAGKPESSATPVIPAGKPESSAMDGKAAFNNHSAAVVRCVGAELSPTVPGLGPGFPAGTTGECRHSGRDDGGALSFRPGRRESAVIPAGMTGERYHPGRDDGGALSSRPGRRKSAITAHPASARA